MFLIKKVFILFLFADVTTCFAASDENLLENLFYGGDTSRQLQGSDAPPGAFPYFVEVLISTLGLTVPSLGALIAPDVVLTVAHTADAIQQIAGSEIVGINAIVGSYNSKSFQNPGSFLRTCEKFVAKPEYVPLEFTPIQDENGTIMGSNPTPFTGQFGGNDFALCKLNAPVNIDTSSVYLELNEDNALPAVDKTAVILGYSYDPTANSPNNLQAVEITVADDAQCDNLFLGPNGEVLFDGVPQMCGFVPPGKGALCRGGDPGTPIVVAEAQPDGRSKHRLSGLFSFGGSVSLEFPCDDLLANYNRVSTVMPWIRQTLCIDFCSTASFCPTLTPKSCEKSKSSKKGKKTDKKGKA
mmetsp:Transcript_3646/g.7553  ORF Transcript_3646/g.7553 Transcript_3646/m.7553 type:complete len:355 (+) Transcript_3646:138-1202(+)|eukprot:CAMPEP_0194323236 /NCGR_PEP_ID=MMETSP0171-20130528/24624_1 /TAXON_ID=218684 /ORGANISM="Corethron pennatum, Strain L29A3" /LENGTH=354 /DNA_ID=CAMNT_0039081795 /DNA_START=133 /DNA_END=1197 /DNA_ORIENTATION=+